MRVFRSDGSFVDDPDDTEFGWYCKDIIIDENIINYSEKNLDMKMYSFLRKSHKNKFWSDSEESLDNNSQTTEVPIEIIGSEIEIEPVKDYVNCESIMNNLTSICNGEEFTNIEGEKDKLANNLNPCNLEAKMLLCVVNHARFKSLVKKEMSQKLLETVNFRSTSSKFLLSDEKQDLNKITNYCPSEDKMLSLMTELITTEVNCDVDNLVNTNENIQQKQLFPRFIIDTSDLDTSITSSNSSPDKKYDRHYLQLPKDKSKIVNHLGLSEEEKSIQCYCEETYEMHKELAIIKKDFKEFDNKLNDLFKTASILNTSIKEELYLNDIIHLLQGDVTKVKMKKLPFKMFHEHDVESDLII